MSALTTGVCEHSAPETTTVCRTEVTETQFEGRGYSKSYKSVPDHRLTGELEVWVDWAQLIRMKGTQALKSKGGRASMLHGAIVIKATNRRKLPL